MKPLGAFQRDFLAEIYGGEPLAGGREVYRRNVLANLHDALAAAYPVVRRLVGDAFFREAADRYARARPSESGDLHRYGAHLAPFLEAYEFARELQYLPDVARLEWAMAESFHEADANAVDFAALQALGEETRPRIRLRLQPAARLLASPHPVLAIWEANQPHRDGTPERSSGGERVLVHRAAGLVTARALGPLEWAFLQAAKRGATLEEMARDPGIAMELPGQLLLWTRLGVVDGFIAPQT